MTAPRQFTPRWHPDRLEPGDRLSRYVVLPGDPPALAREMRRLAEAEAAERGEGMPDDWPREPGR